MHAALMLILFVSFLSLGPDHVFVSAQEATEPPVQEASPEPPPAPDIAVTEIPIPVVETLPPPTEIPPTDAPIAIETAIPTATEDLATATSLPIETTVEATPELVSTLDAAPTEAITETETSLPIPIETSDAGAQDMDVGSLTTAVTVLTGGNNYFLQVDLQDPRVDMRVGLANNDAGGYETLASMKNRYAGQGYAEWAIINGDYFGSGCLSNVNCAQGLTSIDGTKRDNWSAYGTTWPVRANIGFDGSNGPQIAIGDGQTKRFMTVAGGPWIVKDGGAPTCSAQYINGTTYFSTGEQFSGDQRAYCTGTTALTMIGYSADRRYLYMGVSSGGMNVLQLAQWLKDRGAYDVLKLDSGGSSGIYHNGTLMKGLGTRPIANHLVLIVNNSVSCTPNADQITLYSDANYGGSCVTRGIGDYADAGSLGIGNDTVSSIRVGANVQAVLCKDSVYGGGCETLTGDDANLSDNSIGDNQVSSAKVQVRSGVGCNPTADQVALYTDANYGGSCVTKNIAEYFSPAALGIANDSVSSVKVGANVQAMLCRDDGYGGGCEILKADDANLSDNSIGDNQVSSAKIQVRSSGYPVTLYVDANYGGSWCALIGSGWTNVCDGFNDTISSIQIQAGWSARVWQNADLGGSSRCITGDVANLAGLQFTENGSSSLDDAISSVIAYDQPNCPPLVPERPPNFRISGSTQSSVTLAWDDIPNESGYKIYKWNGTSFAFAASVGPDVTSYTETNLPCGSYAYYEVSAFNSTGESEHTGWIEGATQACPAIPVLTDPSDGSFFKDRTINFSWQNPASPGQTGYRIRISPSIDPGVSPWLVNTTLDSTILNYTYTFANDGTFYWHMQTTGSSGNSLWITRSVTIDTVLPTLKITAPVEDGYLSAHQNSVVVLPNDDRSGVSSVQFFVGYDASLSAAGVTESEASLTANAETPLPPLPLLGGVGAAEASAQAWDWHYVSTDFDGTDGWSASWDATSVTDQVVAFYAFAFDRAGNYQGIGIGDVSLDRTAPTCAIDAMYLFSPLRFTVNWSGLDATSGIGKYSVQYQDNAGGWMDWFVNTPATSASFTGLADHSYLLRCRAQDQAGNVGNWATAPVIQTIAIAPPSSAPDLVSPSLNEAVKINTPTFQWSAIGSLTIYPGYRIQIDNNATFASPERDETVGSVLYTPTALSGGTYYWRVQALNRAQDAGPWSGPRTFIIDVQPPGLATLVAPAQGATLKSARPTFSWSLVGGAKQYRLQVSTTSNFSNIVINNVGAAVSYLPTTSLQPGEYYWRVQAYDAANNEGAFTEPRMFSLNILAAPVPNFVSFTTRPAFQWNSVAGATGYELQIAHDANFNFLERSVTTYTPLAGGILTYTPPANDPLDYGRYYWRVNVNLGNGLQPSPMSRFLTITPPLPPTPVIVTPNNAALTNDSEPSFDWDRVTYSYGDIDYEFQIDNNSNFSSPEFTGIDPLSFALPYALSDGLYYWRVRAINFVQIPGAWTAVRTLTIDTIAPPAPTLIAPANRAGTNKAKPVFNWGVVKGTNLYRIQVSTSPDFGIQVIDATTPAASSLATTVTYTSGVSLIGGVYYWHVQARDIAGNWGAWSAPFVFDVTIMRSPANGSFTLLKTPTFQWFTIAGAAKYQLQVATDSGFNDVVVDYQTVNGLTASYIVPAVSALDYGLYYWRVNVDRGSGFEISPVSWQVTITPKAPGAPTLVSPATSLILNDNTPGLDWNGVPDGITYQVQIDNTLNFASPEQDSTGVATDYTASLLGDGLYYWRVRALNSFNAPGAWSAARIFTVDTSAPVAPMLLLPANGTSSSLLQPVFKWGAVAGAIRYEMQLGTLNPPTVTVLNANGLSFVPPGPLLLKTYYWRVRAIDVAGNVSAWSEERSLVMVSASSDVPRLNRFTTSTPTLTWSQTTWAVAYEIQVDNNPTFASPEYGNNTLPAGLLSHTIAALPNGTWYWRIRARNSGGTAGPWSTMGSFIIES